MGCKLSISVVHPESIVNKIKESISPKIKQSRKVSPSNIVVEHNPLEKNISKSPKSEEEYEIYIDSP